MWTKGFEINTIAKFCEVGGIDFYYTHTNGSFLVRINGKITIDNNFKEIVRKAWIDIRHIKTSQKKQSFSQVKGFRKS